jgi:hypothetical protein
VKNSLKRTFANFNEGATTDNIYDGGKMFVEALLSKDYSFIGNSYFNLPKGEDIINDIMNGELV